MKTASRIKSALTAWLCTMAVLLVSGGARAGSFPGSPWAGSGFTDSHSLTGSHAPEGAGQWAWDTPDWGSLDLSSRDISGNVDRALLDEARALFGLALANPNLGRSTPETLGYPVSERGLARAWQYAVDRGAVPSMVDRVFSQARTRLVQQFADAATRLRELDAYNSSIEGRVRRAVEIGYYTPGATIYGLAEVAGVNPFLRGVTGGEITPVLGFREVGLAERGMGLAEMAMMTLPISGAGYADDAYRVPGKLGAVRGGSRQTTILGENMMDRVIPFADRTGTRTLPFGTTPERWAQLTPRQRWKLNDGALRARINEGDNFRYIGIDPKRSPALRNQFDLTRSELLRLNDRGVPFQTVSPQEVISAIRSQ